MQAFPNSGPVSAGYGQPQTTLPILTLDSGDDDGFGYAAFVYDQQNLDYLTADGPGSASGSESGPGLPVSTPSPSSSPGFSGPSFRTLAPQKQQQQQLQQRQHQLPPLMARPVEYGAAVGPISSSGNSRGSDGQAVVPKPRLERRGHTKSRRGCFNCKRRRIKCQETKPACGHCVKQGLKCEYPTLPAIVHQPQHKIPLFSLQDMRFFQHFLLNCYPHHPIGSEEIWTHEVPCLSEKHEYLMHAILGYAASELMATQDPSLAEAALSHRGHGTPPSTTPSSSPPAAARRNDKSNGGGRAGAVFEEGDALMATCFALTYQSVLLEDGMAEYMTFIRGIIIVAIQIRRCSSRTCATCR
ncbi:hypothetical protein VTH06DRAFT_2567 [Thermothelomyces fergusii]